MLTQLKIALVLGTVLFAAAPVCRAEEALDAATKARVEKYEKGPATIDVSKYPQAIQGDYELFTQKCSQCHKLSRPINSDFVLPDEWSRYVKRMMYKPGSNISSAEAKKLYEFLVYDSSVRKKTMQDAKLAALTPEERKQAEKKIKEVMAKAQ